MYYSLSSTYCLGMQVLGATKIAPCHSDLVLAYITCYSSLWRLGIATNLPLSSR